EDAVHVDQPDGAHALALGAFAAIEQQTVSPTAEEHGRQTSAGAGNGAAGAEKEQRQVHGGYGSGERDAAAECRDRRARARLAEARRDPAGTGPGALGAPTRRPCRAAR